jgi:membrane protein
MAANDKSVLGAAIALALMLYGAAAERRRRRTGIVAEIAELETGARGRLADEPHQLGWAGTGDSLRRVFGNIGRDNISLMSAGVAFYGLLSLAPGFTALVALYGLAFDLSQVDRQVQGLEGLIPEEARQLIGAQLTTIVQGNSSSLGIGFLISLALALWSANSGTSALMSALNVAYAEREQRNILRYYGTAMVLTAAGVAFGILALLLVAIVPAILGLLPLGEAGRVLIDWVRWPLLVTFFTLGLAVLYRYAPSRREPRWSWVSPGAAAATILWVAGSVGFSLYVGEFATYNKTYGSLGAVVVLLMWFYVSAFAVLLGAELNAEMEHQTAKDTTDHPAKPLGRRGAYVADTIARS